MRSKIKKVFTLTMLLIFMVNLSLGVLAEDRAKKVEKDNWRFIGEVSGGVVGAILGALVVRAIIPVPSEGGLIGWGQGIASGYYWYMGSILFGIPLGSAAGVITTGRIYGFKSDPWHTLLGSYIGVIGGLLTPLTIVTCPLNAADYFDSQAEKIGSYSLTKEAQ